MSTTFAQVDSTFVGSDSAYSGNRCRHVALTSFYGGTGNGRSLQLTLDGGGYVLFTEQDVIKLSAQMLVWASRVDAERLSAIFGGAALFAIAIVTVVKDCAQWFVTLNVNA